MHDISLTFCNFLPMVHIYKLNHIQVHNILIPSFSVNILRGSLRLLYNILPSLNKKK